MSCSSSRDIDNLVKRLEEASKSSSPSHLRNEERAKLLSAARSLVTALEVPEEKLLNISKGPVGHAVLRTALNFKLFDQFNSDNEHRTSKELADLCGVDQLLLLRLMRTLVGMGFFEELGPEVYTRTQLAKALDDLSFRAVFRGMSETTFVMASLPDYLASLDYRSPTDKNKSLFGYHKNTDQTMFEWFQTQPEQLAIFYAFQAGTATIADYGLKPVLRELLTTPAEQTGSSKDEEVILVDVGGGKGKTVRDICAQLGPEHFKGRRVIVQDLPKVVEGQENAHGVEAMAYSFFEKQPVIGASIYFFRHIFHNWGDEASQQILRNTIPAMRPDSRIVIIDHNIPAMHTPEFVSYIDISMMAFGGLERTEAQWRDLLAGVGLRIVKMYSIDKKSPSSDWVFEVMLEDSIENRDV